MCHDRSLKFCVEAARRGESKHEKALHHYKAGDTNELFGKGKKNESLR